MRLALNMPLLAGDEAATMIIERFARMSARYGTEVELVTQPAPVGVIRATRSH